MRPSRNSRRQFLKRMAQLAIASALPTPFLLENIRASTSSGLARRHFVNLVASGGWDSSWHHNTFSGKHLLGRTDSHFSLSAGGFEFEHRDKTHRYTSKCSSESESELGTHPSGAKLGPAMAAAMQSSDWSRTLIWKGLSHPGFHGNNNRMIIQGNSSSYAISSSGLISAVLAHSDRRPLHYALLKNDPDDLFTNSAMAEDAAIPICLGGLSDFASLTSVDSNEPRDTRIQEELQSSLQKLSLGILAQQTKQASSKTVAQAFGASLEGASFVYGSNLASDPEILYLKKYYFLVALQALADLSKQDALTAKASQISFTKSTSLKYAAVYSGFQSALDFFLTQPLPSYSDFLTNPTSFVTSLNHITQTPTGLGSLNGPVGITLTRLRSQCEAYAFADFLIRRNLSAVVDVPAWPEFIDSHGGTDGCYLDELISMHMTFAMFFAMQRSFAAVEVPGQGGTLLDCTLIALHTEFDRYAFHEAKDDTKRAATDLPAGTNHAASASLLLAGYSIAGNRVIGGVHEGPNMTSAFPEQSYLDPLPMDPNTGTVASSGTLHSILSVAPTLVDAFGTSLPAQQVTDASAVPAALRKTA